MNNWLGLFPGCMLGLVVAAVAMKLEMRPHRAGAGEEEKIISKEHSMVLILLQEGCTAAERKEEYRLGLRQRDTQHSRGERGRWKGGTKQQYEQAGGML